MKTENLIEHALSYVRKGWHVFPVHDIRDGRCTCRNESCQNVGKHPRVKGGFYSATTDENQIKAWCSRWPNANIGIRTGRKSGFWVLDIDPRHDGDDSLYEIEQNLGKLPDTVESLTGGGGRHIWRSPRFFIQWTSRISGW